MMMSPPAEPPRTDRLNKRWYSVVKQRHDPGEAVSQALSGIPTEPGTSAPETIEIDTIAQGGDGGLQVLVKYVAGGGDHATTKTVRWQVVGTAPTSPTPPPSTPAATPSAPSKSAK